MTAAAMRPVRERLVFVWFAGYMILPILALLYYICILQLDESRRREIAVAVVRQDGYDGLAGVFRPLGDG